MISNNPKNLMYIEPKNKKTETPVNDYLTKYAEYLETKFKDNPGPAYRGFHTCACGCRSHSRDYYVSVAGKQMMTNSLLVHYVRDHRSEVPEEELEKLKKGAAHFYKIKNEVLEKNQEEEKNQNPKTNKMKF